MNSKPRAENVKDAICGLKQFIIGQRQWTIEEVVEVAQGRATVVLSDDLDWQARMEESVAFLSRAWQERQEIYGVTTGYGDSCQRNVPDHLVAELPGQLIRFHGCGMGHPLSVEGAMAVLVARMVALAQPVCGVRLEVIRSLCAMIGKRIVPVIPEEGSVGASGDLTPLSYLAAVLVGEREVFYQGQRRLASEVWREVGLSPLQLAPKESLALMNGTSLMTGLACLAYDRAAYLLRLASRLTAMAVVVVGGNPGHFDDLLFAYKPYPGQRQVATWIREDLGGRPTTTHAGERPRLQDRYSLRCAPHVLGVLADALPWMRAHLEIELNSANDNPLIDVASQTILYGGNFYGGHIAFCMDSLKNAVANIADLLDRQMALLVESRTNGGLPTNLSGARPERMAINHGFKAVQIAASAWTAEALKLTLPASIFSRSTECHNQDKVSMGSLAARDALRVLELTAQVAAAVLLAATQGLALRLRSGSLSPASLTPALQQMQEDVGQGFAILEEDRSLEAVLRQTVEHIGQKAWKLYASE